MMMRSSTKYQRYFLSKRGMESLSGHQVREAYSFYMIVREKILLVARRR